MSRIHHWGASHPGSVRSVNEDAYLCRPNIGLFAVADGVGGHAGGGLASSEVISALADIREGLSPLELLAEVRTKLQGAHSWLQTKSAERGGAPIATTIVVLLLRDGHLACFWAGDSRAYLLRNGQLIPITSDHSLVGELVRAGKITEAQAEHHPENNVITRGIGVETAGGELVDKVVGSVEPGDRFLLCSDGLTKCVSGADIAAKLGGDDPAAVLLKAALDAHAGDNVTAVVASV